MEESGVRKYDSGIIIDELNKIRILDPEIAEKSKHLSTECVDFIKNVAEFKKTVESFLSQIEKLEKQIDYEKMKAIGLENILNEIEENRESELRLSQSTLIERKVQLNRLKVQLESYQIACQDQQECIRKFQFTS